MNPVKTERFARLQFPVHKINAKTPLEMFELMPGLRRYFQKMDLETMDIVYPVSDKRPVEGKESVKGYGASYRGLWPDDLVHIIKYIVLVYDPDSDLISEYPEDMRLLKESAAREAGFRRLANGDWPSYVQDVFEFKEKHVVQWINDYLAIRKNALWKEIKYLDEEIEALYRMRTTALLRGEVKSDSMVLIKNRLEEREILYRKFYAEHTDLKRNSQDEQYPTTPENVFKNLKIPDHIWKVRQIKDVPKDARINSASTQ